jgi:hypothetical protein
LKSPSLVLVGVKYDDVLIFVQDRFRRDSKIRGRNIPKAK